MKLDLYTSSPLPLRGHSTFHSVVERRWQQKLYCIIDELERTRARRRTELQRVRADDRWDDAGE